MASRAQNAVGRCAWAPAADQMLELVKIDAGSCYPLGQRREVTHPERLEKAPAEDEFNFFDRPGLDDAHDLPRVADSPCRSPVETGADLPETPTECSTEGRWKDPAVENPPPICLPGQSVHAAADPAQMSLVHPCSEPGCSTLTIGDLCLEHEQRAQERLTRRMVELSRRFRAPAAALAVAAVAALVGRASR